MLVVCAVMVGCTVHCCIISSWFLMKMWKCVLEILLRRRSLACILIVISDRYVHPWMQGAIIGGKAMSEILIICVTVCWFAKKNWLLFSLLFFLRFVGGWKVWPSCVAAPCWLFLSQRCFSHSFKKQQQQKTPEWWFCNNIPMCYVMA